MNIDRKFDCSSGKEYYMVSHNKKSCVVILESSNPNSVGYKSKEDASCSVTKGLLQAIEYCFVD